MGYRLDSRGILVQFPGARDLPLLQTHQTGPPSPLFNRHKGKKLTTELYLVPRLRMARAVPQPPSFLHGMQRDNFCHYTLLGPEDIVGTLMFYCTLLHCYPGWILITELILIWDFGYRNSAVTRMNIWICFIFCNL